MKKITDFLNITPTDEQYNALVKVADFIEETAILDFMIIQGSAGTGKSTIAKDITEYLSYKEIKFALAAPTGKAAKVFQKKTGHIAKTLHSLIYKPEKAKHGCGIKLIRKQNLIENYTIFIIDESSMISDMKGENAIVLDAESSMENYAGLHFKNVKIQYLDSNGEMILANTKVLLESLTTIDGNLSLEQENALAHESNKRNPIYRESQNNVDDPYLGALRLRYGYAITCHKAQGGEWDNVILHPWMPKEDLRWQYTAITRASKDIFTYQCKYQKAA